MNNDVGCGICLDESQEMCSLYRDTWKAESCNQVNSPRALNGHVQCRIVQKGNGFVSIEGVEGTSPIGFVSLLACFCLTYEAHPQSKFP
jgi:hypothetical protein